MHYENIDNILLMNSLKISHSQINNFRNVFQKLYTQKIKNILTL